MHSQQVADRLVFHLTGPNTSYLFRVTQAGHLEHIHWGPRVQTSDADALAVKTPSGGYQVAYADDPAYSLDVLPLEWSGLGKGDFRQPAAELKLGGSPGFMTDFRYISHDFIDGVVPCQDGLPGAHGSGVPAETLRVTMGDVGVELDLYYTTFSGCDVVVRRSVLRNTSSSPVDIRRLMSQQIDLPNRDFDLVTFDGTWAAEAHRHVRPLAPGVYVNDSLTGTSSNRHNPGVILATHGAGEHHGECYAFNLVYPGNHCTAVELSHRDLVRVLSGINPTGFEWTLQPGEQFETPEAVLAYSRDGFDGLSGTLHQFIHDHIVPPAWASAERPIVVNTWESAMFGVDEATVLAQARAGRRLGAELVVLDDGWFKARADDHAGLGDYTVDAKKFPHGLAWLSARVHTLGLKFGLWVEPEMVNPDSDLFRAHPDWAIGVVSTRSQAGAVGGGRRFGLAAPQAADQAGWPPRLSAEDDVVPRFASSTISLASPKPASGLWLRPASLGAPWAGWSPSTVPADLCFQRNQLMLDLSRQDVRDYIVAQVSRAIDDYHLDYVKWDCNRNMTDASGALAHQYALGLCDVLRRIFGPRPRVLLESCASGGNRFDLGMLCFSPQIWASDCTDPVERLDIQDGLSFLYPPSTMGAHVTASPSAQTLRATPLATRFNVAAFGVLGYEFDLTTLSHAERRDVRDQVAFYKRHRRTLQQGRFHRLTTTRPDQFGWATVGQREVIAGHFQTRTRSLTPPGVWQVPGLDVAKRYRVTSRPQTLGLDDFGHLLRFVLPKWLNPEGLIVRALGRWYRLPDAAESFTASGAALSAGYGPSIQFEGNDDRTNTRMWADHGSTLYVVA